MNTSSRSPRILHIIDVADTGGAETVFCSLVRFFDSRRQNVAVVLPRPGWVADQLSHLHTRPTFINSRGSFSLTLLRSLLTVGNRSKCNTIVAHLLGSAVYGSIAGAILGCQVLAIFHGALDFTSPGRFASLKRWLLQRSHVDVVAVSAGVKEALVNWGIAERRVRVIPNGIDTDVYSARCAGTLRAELGIGIDDIVVGAVGNLHPVKGYEFLLAAARLLAEHRPRIHIVIAGEGPPDYRESLEKLRDDLRLGNNVQFLGYRQTDGSYYRSLDIFVSSASSEGLPLSFLEAMSCEIPIVARANEGSTVLLSSAGCGITVPDGNPEEFASAVLKLASDHQLRQELSCRGRQEVLAEYSLARTLRAYGELIEARINR